VVADQNGQVLSGEFANRILYIVYVEIANKVIRKEVYWSGSADVERSKVDFAVLWSRKILKNDTERLFLGDLFTTSMVCDSLLYNATGKIIRRIEKIIKQNNPDMDKNWTIVYHISKLLDVRTPNYESYVDMFYNPS
jgi:Txe/YoeB family toxin of Txe-Axe toxin-antitoxin module